MIRTLLLLGCLAVCASAQSNGSCPGSAWANITTSGSTPTVVSYGGSNGASVSVVAGIVQLIPPPSTQAIHVCSVIISSSAAETITYYGTTSGGAATAISPGFPNVSAFTWQFGGNLYPPITNGFGVGFSASATIGVWVSYYFGYANGQPN
jgi:hypothetical protein